jgi:hypothetical protein
MAMADDAVSGKFDRLIDRAAYDAVLCRVPDVEPDVYDHFPAS